MNEPRMYVHRTEAEILRQQECDRQNKFRMQTGYEVDLKRQTAALVHGNLQMRVGVVDDDERSKFIDECVRRWAR